MSNLQLSYLPGVCKENSAYSGSIQGGDSNGRPNSGRIVDMDKGRFVAGLPEKIGGWVKVITTQLSGVPRGLKDWRDNGENVYLAIGTSAKLYALSQPNIPLNAPTDITPLRAITSGTLTNPFDTNSGSPIVTVHDTAHGLKSGDYVTLSAGSIVDSLNIQGTYPNIAVVDVDTYTIVASSNATGSTTGGGGTVSYIYYRITLTNPFTTVIHSTTVTVTHTSHGAMVGDYADISGASAVGGLTLNGNFRINGTTTNTYTITSASAATSSVSGGGGSPSFTYDINSGNVDSAVESGGYGIGGYGVGGYGTTGTTNFIVAARTWALSHYGQQLYANPSGGTIYIWDPTIGGRAYPLNNAPENISYAFVTAERFVFALGVTSGGSTAMTVAWPDQSDPTNWTPTPTNTANAGRTLQEGSFLVGGVVVRDGTTLVFSNTAVYSFTYSGDNNVYDTTTQGILAGLTGPLAVCVIGGVAYWFGYYELWSWNGSAVPLPTDDVRDYIYRDINISQSAKFVVASNIAKKEVWGFYCSSSSQEIDRYWIYHIDQNCFSIGSLVRTAWIDRELFAYPIATDSNGFLYYQENGNDGDGSAIDFYIQSSPIEVSRGETAMDIFTFIPDFERQNGEVDITLYTQIYPQDTPTVYGPYPVASDGSTPRIDLRINGKLVAFKIENNVLGGDVRLGIPKVEAQKAGARR